MRNRLRSILTMLGIVWGLVSVVILLAYGQGLGGSVLHAFMNMGDNVIVIFPGQTSMQAGGSGPERKSSSNTRTLRPYARKFRSCARLAAR